MKTILIVRRITVLILFVLLSFSTESTAQNDGFLTISNSRSRAIAMGGAFTAVEDDLCAVSFNPGTFSLIDDNPDMRLMVHFNPVMPAVSLNQRDKFRYVEEGGMKAALGSIHYMVKSIMFSAKIVNIGILFNEEGFNKSRTSKIFDGTGFRNNLYHTAVLSINLSSQIRLGVTGSIIRSVENDIVQEGKGLSYGVLVKPNSRYQVGISYFDFSNELPNFRRPFDRIADESLNAGLAFFPWEDVIISVDVRNLTESSERENFALQEFHFGFESNRLSHFSFRGGYYREKFADKQYSNIFSAGIGLLDLNRFNSIQKQYNHNTPLINYTILFENTPLVNSKLHLLTIGFRL
ncbi:hypothetical protein ACFL5P_02705 [candidate division KSB1 bacterium]